MQSTKRSSETSKDENYDLSKKVVTLDDAGGKVVQNANTQMEEIRKIRQQKYLSSLSPSSKLIPVLGATHKVNIINKKHQQSFLPTVEDFISTCEVSHVEISKLADIKNDRQKIRQLRAGDRTDFSYVSYHQQQIKMLKVSQREYCEKHNPGISLSQLKLLLKRFKKEQAASTESKSKKKHGEEDRNGDGDLERDEYDLLLEDNNSLVHKLNSLNDSSNNVGGSSTAPTGNGKSAKKPRQKKESGEKKPRAKPAKDGFKQTKLNFKSKPKSPAKKKKKGGSDSESDDIASDGSFTFSPVAKKKPAASKPKTITVSDSDDDVDFVKAPKKKPAASKKSKFTMSDSDDDKPVVKTTKKGKKGSDSDDDFVIDSSPNKNSTYGEPAGDRERRNRKHAKYVFDDDDENFGFSD